MGILPAAVNIRRLTTCLDTRALLLVLLLLFFRSDTTNGPIYYVAVYLWSALLKCKILKTGVLLWLHCSPNPLYSRI